MQHHSFRLLSDKVPQTEKQIDTAMKNNGKNLYLAISIVLGIVWPAALIFLTCDMIKDGFEPRRLIPIFNCLAIGVFWVLMLKQYRKIKKDYENT